ncbi:DNA repair protein SWI5 homolog isoform X2 [Cricetulus griseus]|uniref:DNA repair protein SWI5 homolog n=1 Tax=Cricetulus griseus TaxID=10029 RepID=A0A9J7JT99_CRIGR|nr:DNA repair protein SWI5 homolog isoform X2 [Cricetulus griseus]
MNDREAWSRCCQAGAAGGGVRLTPTLDPSEYKTTPIRVPRTSGFRRWARSAHFISPPFPDSPRLIPDFLLPGPSQPALRTIPFPRAELGFGRSCHGAFRSPCSSPKLEEDDEISEETLNSDIQKLKEKRDMLDKEISQLVKEGYRVGELEDHIALLHEYNDIKDVAQMLLGKLALTRGVTTKELYPDFGLDLSD